MGDSVVPSLEFRTIPPPRAAAALAGPLMIDAGAKAAPATQLRVPRARVGAGVRNPTATRAFERPLGSRVRGGRRAVAGEGRGKGRARLCGAGRRDAPTVISGGGGCRKAPEICGVLGVRFETVSGSGPCLCQKPGTAPLFCVCTRERARLSLCAPHEALSFFV